MPATLHAFFASRTKTSGEPPTHSKKPPSRKSLGVSPLQSPRPTKTERDEPSGGSGAAAASAPKRPRVESDAGLLATQVSSGSKPFTHNLLPFVTNPQDAKGRRPTDPDYDGTTLLIPTKYKGKPLDKHEETKNLFTDGMKTWWDVKKVNFDAVLLYKVGKFYEMFNMDAELGVQELGLKWMGDPTKGGKAHAGFPEVSFQRYAQQLVDRNYRVVRVEQTETPAMMRERTGKTTGCVRREACQFLSAGTNFSPDDEMLKDHTPKCLLCLVEHKAPVAAEGEAQQQISYGVCILDPSTSAFEVGGFVEDIYQTRLSTLFSQLRPAEILFQSGSLSVETTTSMRREAANTLLSPQSADSTWGVERTLAELSSGYFDAEDAMEAECDRLKPAAADTANWPPILQVRAVYHCLSGRLCARHVCR